MVKHYDIIIIGGGISGLSVAHYASQQNQKVLLLEKNTKVGGCVHTYTSEKADGFWLEMGAHAVYNSYDRVLQLVEALSLKDQIQTRRNLPFKLYDGIQTVSVFKALNLVRMGMGILKLKMLSKKDCTVSDYYQRIFGKTNYQNILRYAFDAVLSQDSKDFPAELLFKFYKRNKNFPRSFTFKNGLSILVDALVKSSDFELKTNAMVTNIKRVDNLWHVVSGNESYTCQKLVLATPLSVTRVLLPEEFSGVAEKLTLPQVSKITSFGVIVNKNIVKDIPALAGLIGIEQPFYSMVSRDVVNDDQYRGFIFHFKGELEYSQTQCLDYALRFLGVSADAVVDSVLVDNTLPMITPEFLNGLTEMQQALFDKDIYLTGNYFSRLAIEDCVRQSESIL